MHARRRRRRERPAAGAAYVALRRRRPCGDEPPRHGRRSAHQRGPDEEQVLRSDAAAGACGEPPTMRPTTPPAAISGKNRFACRVSETRPASPQIARRQVNSATLWRIQSAPYTQVASASTAAREQGGDGDRSRDDDEHTLASDPRQQRADADGGQEHCDSDEEVKHRELLDAVAGEEERVDAALGDHDGRVGKEGNGYAKASVLPSPGWTRSTACSLCASTVIPPPL